jgi:elongator complex protein 3
MKANLRQDILETMKQQGTPCRCIRCREPRRDSASPEEAQLVIQQYETLGGTELFISYENKERTTLYGFVRLRLPKDPHPKIIKKLPDLKDAAIIRELHVYGAVSPINSGEGKVQHRGFGKKLMAEAEKIAQEHGYAHIAVISGIGVRQYYEKIGYHLADTYMVKKLS